MWGRASLERFEQDLRYAFRILRKSPGFTFAAILTLALGIGANTAIFSVVYGVLLRPLPHPGADGVAIVHVRFSPQNTEYGTMSIADYLDWKSQNHAFEDPAIFTNAGWRFDLTGTGEPIEVAGCAVTDNFFSVLRSGPMLGRVFRSGESAPAAAPAVVLSEPLWREHFHGPRRGWPHNESERRPGHYRRSHAGLIPLSAGDELWTDIRLRPPTGAALSRSLESRG